MASEGRGHDTTSRPSRDPIDGRDVLHGPYDEHSPMNHSTPDHDHDATGAHASYWNQSYDRTECFLTRTNEDHVYREAPSWRAGSRSGQSRALADSHSEGDDQFNPDYLDSDTVPLTSNAQVTSGSFLASHQETPSRNSFQTVSDVDVDTAAARDTLHPTRDVEFGNASSNHQSYGMLSASAHDHPSSRPSSTSGALLYAGSIVRAVSQRVVNISGDNEEFNQRTSRRSRSRSSPRSSRRPSVDPHATQYYDEVTHPAQLPIHTSEKNSSREYLATEIPPTARQRHSHLNPLKGRTLGFFGPDSPVRTKLCNALVNPYTEPLILLLIVVQTVLLTVESAPSVFTPGNERPERWGRRWIDWAMLALFLVFTLELCARIIVSGFILNAAEYSTIDRKKGIRAAIEDQYRAVFQPQRHKSVKVSMQFSTEPSTITRTFTTFVQGQQALPKTLEDQLRFSLARRAFLRHSFNRLDFVAVVAYWVALALGASGLEHHYRIYVFKMLSCLRVLRLLAVTHGTSIILRSLKKAAPLLVRVAFLICFFWLLFAIIGVQSFKSSFARQCVWLDPLDPTNLAAAYSDELSFCGGHLDNVTGVKMPWVKFSTPDSLNDLINGTSEGKGFLCPRGSLCLEQGNPFNGTVNFDNIVHSLELVFVIMGANTFSVLMYYTMGSDYSFAALFFGAGVMIMTLWLVNLLIAVITSSFQVIREESKSSAFTAEDEKPSGEAIETDVRPKTALQRYYETGQLFWVIVITFDLIVQAFRSSDMPRSRVEFIDVTQIVVTILLVVDMLVRIIVDRRHFHRSWRNIFDLGLAVITSIILLPPIHDSGAYPWLTVFQILRAYRIVMAVPTTRNLIMLVLGNAAGIANLMLFVFLMTFLVAILAAQLFRGEVPLYEDGELNTISFYTIYNSFLGIYQVLTTEGWTEILYSVTSYTEDRQTSWIGAAFLIGWFILSFFILISMFIAVIQENFDVSEDEKRLEQVKAFLQKRDLGSSSSNLALSTIFGLGKSKQRRDPLDYGPAMTEMLLKDAVVKEFLDDPSQETETNNEPQAPLRSATNILGDVRPGTLSKLWGNLVRRITKREPNPFYASATFNALNDTLDARQMAQQAVSAASSRRKAQREYLARHPTYNNSLFLFTPRNRLRRLCQRLVGPARGSERFDGLEPNKIAWYSFSAFIYAAIVAMVIIACITTPLYQKEYQERNPGIVWNWYVWTDVAFAVLFTFESAIKIIADGLFHTPNAYLRSSWGIVDAAVLITLWINVVTLLVNDGTVSRAIGAFKAFRALRLLNVSNSARDTFHSLIIVGWWKLFGAAFISISLLIPFAIYGLNLFNGLLVACNDGDGIEMLEACFGEFNSAPYNEDWPLLAPRVASNPYFSFDDFASSLFTLFQIVSQEGWTDVSFAAQAIIGRGLQPQDLAAEGNAMFFVVFNLLATVFILTLFISVFMRNYTEQTGVAYLTGEQRSWLELRKLLRQVSPSKSSYDDTSRQTWKRWCHKRAIEKRGKWYQTITVVLVFHLILLMIEFRGEPDWWETTRSVLFFAFILLYMSNIMIRLTGLGWTRFRRSAWDLYSLACVFGAFISTLAVLIVDHRRDEFVQIHKYFLVSIVLLVIPRNDALDQLFKTAAASLTVISNLLATWLVLFLVFAIAFTQAFSLTRFGGEAASDINFRTVPNALILLFRMSFGEGWNAVMEDYAAIEPPLCVEVNNFFQSDCGSKPWARFLFVAWNILSMYIFVNLFVSLIYESFSYVYQRSSWVAAVDRDEIRRFKEAWRRVDPAGTGAISKDVFPRLLGELSGVFQMRIYEHEDSVHQILEDVQNDTKPARHSSIATNSGYGQVDIAKLNERLARLDVNKIRERRRRFNLFYEEVLVSADPDRGITFTGVLMILSHYNIINDSKSLKLDEFLRRRARLQRVDDSVRRQVVQGFFDTLYWSRKFKKHKEAKLSSRMTTIPQLDIPHILVDEGDDNDDARDGVSAPQTPVRTSVQWESPAHLSAGARTSGHLSHSRSSSGGTVDAEQRGSVWHHPLSLPRSASSTPSPPLSPSNLGFELRDVSRQTSPSGELHRRTSSVSPTQAREMLDDSVWMESIRRSTTSRRSNASHRYADLGP